MNQYFTSIFYKNLEDNLNYCDNHISIEKVKSSNNTQSELFTFNLFSSDEIKREVLTPNNLKGRLRAIIDF